jgi:hypothetical protein
MSKSHKLKDQLSNFQVYQSHYLASTFLSSHYYIQKVLVLVMTFNVAFIYYLFPTLPSKTEVISLMLYLQII